MRRILVVAGLLGGLLACSADGGDEGGGGAGGAGGSGGGGAGGQGGWRCDATLACTAALPDDAPIAVRLLWAREPFEWYHEPLEPPGTIPPSTCDRFDVDLFETADELQPFLATTGDPVQPQVDWATERVVALSTGQCGTGGNHVALCGAGEVDGALRLQAGSWSGATGGTVVSQAYALLAIPRTAPAEVTVLPMATNGCRY